LLSTAALLALSAVAKSQTVKATLYKNPQCSCCEA
jgi:hypothetical protein